MNLALGKSDLKPLASFGTPESVGEPEMTIEQILLRGSGRQQGNAPVRHGVPRPGRRRRPIVFPPPPRWRVARWSAAHPLLAAFAVYVVWMIGWGAHLWMNSGYE